MALWQQWSSFKYLFEVRRSYTRPSRANHGRLLRPLPRRDSHASAPMVANLFSPDRPGSSRPYYKTMSFGA